MPQEKPQSAPALLFALALVRGDRKIAHDMLSVTLKSTYTVDSLAETYRQMTEFADDQPDQVAVMETLNDWPGQEAGDLGWAYVSIGGLGWSEAVTVVVSVESGLPVIRSIEWGRP